MTPSRFNRKRVALRFLLIIPAIMALLAWVVMLLWNAILTPVLLVKPIGFWQAGGLLILCRILFGGFGRAGWGRPRGSGPPFGRNRFSNMTPEEKERIRAEWKKRCVERKKQ
ncbi:hypothetical protein [Salmonirosea aquatica]|uniref:Uncharacterized protein n=1 Tax=Salmonirosea aquatica TaxID=2654236 RepID=A0A7C9BJP7_9BACT|nr:hypothetical protein [Cytophagaceae bacterium SJW1-29]